MPATDEPTVFGSAVVRFQSEIASIDAIQRAAYRLSDRLVVDLSTDDRSTICTLATTEGETPGVTLIGEFKRHVLDQMLRERIREQTADVRNVVLAHTFAALTDPDE